MNFRNTYLILFILFLQGSLHAQQVLDDYLKQGIDNNRMLKDRSITVEQGMLALKEAKSYFLPSLNVIGNYTTADGGRVINLPIGDLVNPAYQALNQLTGSNAFPTLENVQEQFLPKNFYDARFRLSYPLLNNDLYVNRSVKAQAVAMDGMDVEIYKLELTKEIKVAYYNFCMAREALTIYENALELVQQNVKTSKSLFENGKGLQAQVLRAESELANINAQIANAKSRLASAREYFNFLINRPLESEIVYEASTMPDGVHTAIAMPAEVSQRLELRKIDAGIGINNTLLRGSQRYTVPKLSTFMDFGSQGFDFEFNNQSRYYLLGVQLDMPIYNGGRNRLKINQTKLAIEKLQNSKAYTSEQLQLAVSRSQHQLRAALVAYDAAIKQQQAAQSYFNIVNRGYEEGVNSLIEFIDARNQYTNATLQQKINYYQVLSTYAEYQRQTSSN